MLVPRCRAIFVTGSLVMMLVPHVARAGDPETMVHYSKINTKEFPFGGAGDFSFPKELIVGPAVGPE